MESYEYIPKDVCATKMVFTINGDTIIDVKVDGGCLANNLSIRSLVQNQKIDDVIKKMDGLKCCFKKTSCPDQLAKALKEYKEKRDLI